MKHWKVFGILGIIAALLVWGAVTYFSKPAQPPQMIRSYAEKEMDFQNRRLEHERQFPPPTGKSGK